MIQHKYAYMTDAEFVRAFQQDDHTDKLTLEVCREALARLEAVVQKRKDWANGYDA